MSRAKRSAVKTLESKVDRSQILEPLRSACRTEEAAKKHRRGPKNGTEFLSLQGIAEQSLPCNYNVLDFFAAFHGANGGSDRQWLKPWQGRSFSERHFPVFPTTSMVVSGTDPHCKIRPRRTNRGYAGLVAWPFTDLTGTTDTGTVNEILDLQE